MKLLLALLLIISNWNIYAQQRNFVWDGFVYSSIQLNDNGTFKQHNSGCEYEFINKGR